ncbi:MAG: AMIN domain-containing protein [Deltaproteobacteria bacterium]|nr:AMIN domain-containing protein [Deltaproteobacteria bacterium]
MVFVRRALALTTAVALAFPVSAFAKEKPALSSLKGIELVAKSDDIVVTLEGTKAPDFTSFTMTDPFRVVVDWAGSNVDKVEAERSFDRGLVRRILTKQFNSEAEQISRVTIELARETAYQVEAEGTRVRIHFVPVPDPIPEPQPVAAPTPKVEEKVVAQAIPEGPLTEPDLPVPTDLPPLSKPKPQVVAQTPVPAPAPAPIPTPTPAPAPEPVKVAPAPAPVVAAAPVAPSKPDRKEAPAERQATPVTLASTKVEAPKALDKPAELPAPGTPAPKPAPAPTPAPAVVAKVEPKPAPPAPVVVAKVEPKPEPKTEAPKAVEKPAEPVKLASLNPPAPDTKPVLSSAPPAAPEAKMEAPEPAPTRVSLASTQRLANQAPRPKDNEMASGWSPPGVLPTVREQRREQLPVVKIAQDTLQPSGNTPADADVDDPGSSSGGGGADANDFDPGPRVMKYVGFQQMADVSRVFVRVDGKAKYRSAKEGGGKVVLELVNTSINVKNNERPLDTTYFNSPVSKVQAVKNGDNTRIEISLREGAGFTVKRIGTTIAVDFKRGG